MQSPLSELTMPLAPLPVQHQFCTDSLSTYVSEGASSMTRNQSPAVLLTCSLSAVASTTAADQVIWTPSRKIVQVGSLVGLRKFDVRHPPLVGVLQEDATKKY